jgi:hypothetical protein
MLSFPDSSLTLPPSSLSLLLDLNPLLGLGIATLVSTPPAMPRGLLSAPTPAATRVFGSRLAAVGEEGA